MGEIETMSAIAISTHHLDSLLHVLDSAVIHEVFYFVFVDFFVCCCFPNQVPTMGVLMYYSMRCSPETEI